MLGKLAAVAVASLVSTGFTASMDPQVTVYYNTRFTCDLTGDYSGEVKSDVYMDEPGGLATYVAWSIMDGPETNVDEDENSSDTLYGTYVTARAFKTGGFGGGISSNAEYSWFISVDASVGSWTLYDELYDSGQCEEDPE